MVQTMNRYEKYKPSGVDWIGEVPYNWQKKRIKDFYSSNMGETILQEDLIEDGRIPVYSATESDTIFGYVNDANVILEPGDIVIPARGNSIGNSKIVEAESTCTQTTIYCKQISNRVIPKFIFYYNYGLKDFLFHFDNTAIPQITVRQVRNNPIFLPKTVEQLAIANYLDDQTQKIDRLIANKKAQAEKLKELRQIEINNAVTKGLNHNAEMKDSGIEWLGKIPKHWEVKRLKNYTTKIGSGVTPKGGSEVYEDFGIPIFRSQNIHFDGLRLDDVAYINEEIHNSMSGSKVMPEDVLLNITGASIGRCFYYDGSLGEANVNQHVCIIRTNKKLSHLFLYLFLSSDSGQSQIFMGQVGTSREGLTFQDIKNIIFAVPPKEEQIQIANHLQQRTTAIDRLIKNLEAQIEKLQELRKIKIYEAVTGKIKVTEP